MPRFTLIDIGKQQCPPVLPERFLSQERQTPALYCLLCSRRTNERSRTPRANHHARACRAAYSNKHRTPSLQLNPISTIEKQAMASIISEDDNPLGWTPPPSEDLSSPPPGLQIGAFSSTEVRFWYDTTKQVFRKIQYERPYPGPPGLVLALTAFDLFPTSPHLAASASDICSASFTANISSRQPYHEGRLSWLAIPEDKDFLYGTVHAKIVSEDRSSRIVIRPVQFQRKFVLPPKIILWLSEVELGQCVRVSAADIHTCGFSVRLETNDPAETVNDAVVSWVAYPADRAGIYSGTASTEAQRPTTQPQLYNTGYIGFPEGVFKKAPRVMVGLNYLDLGSKQYPRIRVQCSNVNIFGMTWEANSWVDTIVSGAGISYLAFE
ncbi:hypothetical protein L873DRAFT_1085978 [Choiromyces venosus 120613-1]|uniref:H-type lectin domain-containing protein n=1 Tax=Choiromyces venosus 120613-1 TaxID=1336337 RepID=A0A3N4JL70_9PEZI|nr:hypothetical protein L873DRAFT_1085978 [Choiromyces venosus 120613-1]